VGIGAARIRRPRKRSTRRTIAASEHRQEQDEAPSPYWAAFVTTASELFGTNLRASAAVSAPNVVRALAVPITSIWFALKPALGPLAATRLLGIACCALGLACCLAMRETFHRDLAFEEA
jgi:hypothetical protein